MNFSIPLFRDDYAFMFVRAKNLSQIFPRWGSTVISREVLQIEILHSISEHPQKEIVIKDEVNSREILSKLGFNCH